MNDKRTALPNARQNPRFAGLGTFCRFPQICHVAPENQPVDWAVYGIPYDGGVTYRPGARFGAQAVRDASRAIRPYHTFHDVNLAEVFSLADAGDAPVSPYSCAETQEQAAAYARGLGSPGHTRLFAVGGDHSIALANMRATYEAQGRPEGGMALIHFDSHIDTVDVVWGEKHTHASVFRRAFEEGLINPSRMITIGIKGPLNMPDDWDYARDQGVEIVSYDDWRREGSSRIDEFADALGEAPTYLSFDIDVVDPAFAPGTGTPSFGGFTSGEAIDLLRRFGGVNLVGADLVEVLPDLDPSGITAGLAAQVLFEILCLDAVRVGRGA